MLLVMVEIRKYFYVFNYGYLYISETDWQEMVINLERLNCGNVVFIVDVAPSKNGYVAIDDIKVSVSQQSVLR